MLPVRALHVKRVKMWAGGNSAGMAAGMAARSRVGYATINADLVI